MAVHFSNIIQPGLLSQQHPPPLLPKPRKDNARLQKFLKKSAKKKASVAQTTQSTATFRSSLSPVNEASPDLEHSDHSTPPQTPETPLYGISRCTVRPLYQHVHSPYPQRATFGINARFTPQMVETPSHLSSQTMVPTPSIPVMTISAVQVTSNLQVTCSPFAEIHVGINSAVGIIALTQSPIPTFRETQTLLRPLTMLTPLIKPKSPRPNFKATETSKLPKPMFEVPQIRMYTANTSYYETSRTPQVYDSAGLTSIGSTLPQSKTPTLETKQDTLSSEVNRLFIPRFERPENLKERVVKPTGQTPLLENSKTSIFEIRKGTADMDIVTPTSEIKRETQITDIKGAKTPIYDISSRTPYGRPKTPSYQVNRATTPIFEISKPNPLLFAVSSVEPERSSTPTKASTNMVDSKSVKTEETVSAMTTSMCTLNGDSYSDTTAIAAKSIKEIQKLKSKSAQGEITAPVLTTATFGYLMPKALSLEPSKDQRPKTPTNETQANVPHVTLPCSYKKPTTPTNEEITLVTTEYQRLKTTPAGLSPVGFQRPKTPTSVTPKPKSLYRGLTPSEFVAHGEIQSYSPAFGISRSPVPEEVKPTKEVSSEDKISAQESLVKTLALAEVSTTEENPPKEEGKPCMPYEEVFTISPMFPTIVVSQASDVSERTLISVVDKPTDKTLEKELITPATKSNTPEAFPISTDNTNVSTFTAIAGHAIRDTAQAAEHTTAAKVKTDISVQPSDTTTSTQRTEVSVPAKPVVPNKTTVILKGRIYETTQEKAVPTPEVESSPENKYIDSTAFIIKVSQKTKGLKSKLSGWSRLKKHMVVEQEEPKFPELSSQKEASKMSQSDTKKDKEKNTEKSGDHDVNSSQDAPKATQMWDAVLFQMFSSKENIMHQIELNKCEGTKVKDEPNEIPAFAHRLPVLLFCPKFDAKKLKEAASRPVTKIATVFEMGLIGRKNKYEEPKDFNRTARGFAA